MRLACLATLALGLSTIAAHADTFTVSIVQSGNNVVATGNGSFSVSGSNDSGTVVRGAQSNNTYLILGSGQNDMYTGVSGPGSFGSMGYVLPTSSTGNQAGIFNNFFVVPFGYVADTNLTDSDTWNNTALSGLGFAVEAIPTTWVQAIPS